MQYTQLGQKMFCFHPEGLHLLLPDISGCCVIEDP